MHGQIEAAERVELRRWLTLKGIEPLKGCTEKTTAGLSRQVWRAGGDAPALMAEGRAEVKRRREEARRLRCGSGRNAKGESPAAQSVG